MSIPRILCALSAFTLLSGVVYAAPETAPLTPQTRLLVDTTWDMSPIDNSLKPKQVEFLNLYMNYPDSSEMSKLSKYVKEILPVYIALHEKQLDQKSIIHFRVTQLLNVGMTFNDIALLQGAMASLRAGKQPDPIEMKLLKVLILDMKKNQRISLNPWFRPLFSYVANNPGDFTRREQNSLRDALLASVGLTPKELKMLYDFADKRSSAPVFSEKEEAPVNKLILLAYLQGVDLLNPEKISYLQFAINQNKEFFGAEKVEAFNKVVDTSKIVGKYKYEFFKANNVEMKGFQNKPEIENSQSKYLEQQMSKEEIAARQRYLKAQQVDSRQAEADQVQSARQRYYEQQQQPMMPQQVPQMTLEQQQAYQRQLQQQQAYKQQMQQQAVMQQRAPQMTPQQQQAYQRQMQQQQAYQQQMQQQQMQ